MDWPKVIDFSRLGPEYGPLALPFYAESVGADLHCAAYDVAEDGAGDGAVVEMVALPSGG